MFYKNKFKEYFSSLELGKLSLLSFMCMFAFTSLLAQEKINFSEYKTKFPNDDVVHLNLEEKVIVKIKGGKLDITSQNYTSNLFLTERANEYASAKIYFSASLQEIGKINAQSIIPDKNAYKTLNAEEKKATSSISSGSFYDDHLSKTIMFPGLQAGARTVLSYDEKIKDPHFLGGFHFRRYAPIQSATFSVEFPSNVKIKYIFIGDSSKVNFSKKTNGKITNYTWEAKNIEKLPYENDAPDLLYYTPHVILYMDEYTLKGEKSTVFGNVDRLHAWYYELTKDLNKKENDKITLLVDSLVKDSKSDYDKLKKIYYWVQDHVKYIAFEDGMGGFIPREAADVCHKRYGDCKDMANLLYAMISQAKIPVSRAWIGTRDIPYTYNQVPTPATDNHMIAIAKLDGKNYFLDATGGFLPIEFPTPMIQGKEALLSLGKDKYEIVKVPEVAYQKNIVYDSSKIHIEGTDLKGTFNTIITGLEKFNVTNNYIDYGKTKRAEELQKSIKIGNNKSKISSLEIKGFDDRDSALHFRYDVNVPDYILKRDKEIFINMCLSKPFQTGQIDTTEKKLDKENKNKYIYKAYTSLEVPAGYKAKLPANASWKNNLFGFNTTYLLQGNSVICRQEIFINYLILSPGHFAKWNEMIDALQDSYKQVVVLKQ